MKAILGRLLIGIASIVATTGCDVVPSRYRARMTVEVETPQGLRTGSSVLEILAGKTMSLTPESAKAQVELHGEAVAVDLPGGETLFALLRTAINDQSLQRAITAALDPNFEGGAEGFLESVPKLGRPENVGRSAVLPASSYPVLVRFRNIADPKSVEAVDPNNLPGRSEAGVALRRITVTVTNGAVTSEIEKRLPWLPGLHGSYLDGSSIGTAHNDGMHAGYFSTELFK